MDKDLVQLLVSLGPSSAPGSSWYSVIFCGWCRSPRDVYSLGETTQETVLPGGLDTALDTASERAFPSFGDQAVWSPCMQPATHQVTLRDLGCEARRQVSFLPVLLPRVVPVLSFPGSIWSQEQQEPREEL